MRKKPINVCLSFALSIVLLFGSTVLLAAQDGLELSSLVPPDPLIYLEMRDFGGRLQQLLETDFAGEFPNTRAFKDFTKTKLYNKLADRIDELEEVTGFRLSVERAREIAGSRAAFALYDIGELRFVFLSRIPSDMLAASALWRMRERFEQRKVDDLSYYVKEDPDGRVSLMFTSIGDTIVVGTDFNRFEACLLLLDRGGQSLADSEKFKAAFPAGFEMDDAVLYLDQERISRTPYFRSYWIYGNQSQLSDIQQVAINVGFSNEGISETRWLTTSREPQQSAGNEFKQLARSMPGDADLYLYSICSDIEDFGAFFADELFEDAGEALAEGISNALGRARPQAFGLAVAASLDEDGFFLDTSKTLVVRLNSPEALDKAALEAALANYFANKLLQPGQAEFHFVNRSGLRVLDMPLFGEAVPAYKMLEDLLVISNSTASLQAASGAARNSEQEEFVTQADNPNLLLYIDAGSTAEHLKAYFKVVSQRDNWRSSGNAAFFWRNAVSLLDSLDFLDRIILSRAWEGRFLVERIAYKLKQ